MGVRFERLARLDPPRVRAVTALVDAAADTDGVGPLSEHVMLHLRHGGDDPARNLLLYDGDELVGYAHLDVTDPVEGPSAELAVAPAARRRGHGQRLVQQLLDETGGSLRLWAHGESDAARALAERLGFRRDRALWQMRRSLLAPLPEPELPAGVSVRTFEVGRDEERWVRVNGRAFAAHPEQGGWTVEDLRMREREPWFDPAGFFLAERGDDLVGFHWTKVHGSDGGHHHHEPIGEVYVVGVDPSMQGQRLGPALTLVGLRHLRARGLSQVMLYVDETNTNAIQIYRDLGFSRWDTDLQYRHG